MTTETLPISPRSILRLIWIPAIISLGVTLLRLTGELRHWSERWFSRETGGADPHGVSWLIGITWLAVPFGILSFPKIRSRLRLLHLLGSVVSLRTHEWCPPLTHFDPAPQLSIAPRTPG